MAKGRKLQARERKSDGRFVFLVPVVAFVVLLALASGGLLVGSALEENNVFCASCHSQPEVTYVQRTQASAPVDLASWHDTKATKCIACHSGVGVPGRLSAMSVGAGDLLAWVSGRAKQPAPLTVPIADANCMKCHPDTEQTQDFNLHFHRFLPRWQAMDPKAATCVSCHSAHTTDGRTDLQYLTVSRTQAVCNACHNTLREG